LGNKKVRFDREESLQDESGTKSKKGNGLDRSFVPITVRPDFEGLVDEENDDLIIQDKYGRQVSSLKKNQGRSKTIDIYQRQRLRKDRYRESVK